MALNKEFRTEVYAWYVVVILNVANAISVADRYMMGLVVEPMKVQLHFSDTQIAFLQGPAFLILFCLFSIPIGMLADTMSRRTLLAAGLLLWSLATGAVAFSNSFETLFLARAFVGLGEACLLPTALPLISAYFPPEKLGRATGLFTLGGSEGKLIAFLGGGALFAYLKTRDHNVAGLHIFSPWQELFLFVSVPGLLLAALILLSLREPARVSRNVSRLRTLKETGGYIYSHLGTYTGLAASAAASYAMQMILAAWGVSYFVRIHDYSIAQAGGLIGIVAIAALLGVIGGGLALDRLRNTRLGASSALVVAASALCLMGLAGISFRVFENNVLGAIIGYVGLQFFLCATVPSIYACIQMVTPDRYRGGAVSCLAVFYILFGGAIGPTAVGLLTDHVFIGSRGIAPALSIVTTTFGLLGAGIAMLSLPHYRRTYYSLHGDDGRSSRVVEPKRALA